MESISQRRPTPFSVSSLLALLLLTTAAISFGWFNKVAAIAFLAAAWMSWSRPFEQNRQNGKSTLSNGGRWGVGAVFAAIGVLFLWLPGKMAVGTEPMAPSFSASEAAPICEDAARDQITHPSTADFSILGIDFKSFDDGTAMFTTTYTARNGFNLELEYQLACEFTGSKLTTIKIEEAR